METLIASVLVLATPVNLSQAMPEQAPVPVEIPVDTPQQGTEPETEFRNNLDPTSTTCPSGQFPSAFSDVYPTDWAYQAVNRLSSKTVQCFDYPKNL